MADAPRLTLPQEGRLATHPLALLLGRLGVLRATGVLDVARRKLTRRFVLDGGTLVAAVSNAREDRFYDWLRAGGHLDHLDQTDLAALEVNVGEAPLTAGPLLALGVLPAAEVGARLAEHLRALLADTAAWADATFAIRPGRVALGREPLAALPALAPALDGARAETAAAKRPLPLPRRVAAPMRPDDAGHELLAPAERAVLDACAGAGAEPLDLARALGREHAEVQAALGALWRAGLLVDAGGAAGAAEEEGELTAESLERWLAAAVAEDFEALLGVAAGADPGTVREAYYRTVRRYHPDRFRGGPFAARHREVEQAFRLVHEAVQVLSDPTLRAERDARRVQAAAGGGPVPQRGPAEVAAEAYARAADALEAGKRADALQHLQRAVAALPNEPTYLLHLGLLLAANPARRAEGLERLAALAKAEAGRVDVLSGYALALVRAGRAAAASPFLANVRRMDPRHPTLLALSGDEAGKRTVRQDPFLALFFPS